MTEEVHPFPEEEAPAGERPESPATEESEGLSVEDIALLKTDEIREAFAKAKERDEVKDRLLRLQAEFENFRRREARDRANWRRNAIRDLALDVLQVVDNFERALAADPGPDGHADFVRGIELVEKQLTGVLEKAGVRPIAARGEPFDPALHEAVATAPSDEAVDGTVLEEVQRGYTIDDVVLRPTRVCVVQNPAPAEGDAESPVAGDGAPEGADGDGDD
jgi:molecular chaperone GrpE